MSLSPTQLKPTPSLATAHLSNTGDSVSVGQCRQPGSPVHAFLVPAASAEKPANLQPPLLSTRIAEMWNRGQRVRNGGFGRTNLGINPALPLPVYCEPVFEADQGCPGTE